MAYTYEDNVENCDLFYCTIKSGANINKHYSFKNIHFVYCLELLFNVEDIDMARSLSQVEATSYMYHFCFHHKISGKHKTRKLHQMGTNAAKCS